MRFALPLSEKFVHMGMICTIGPDLKRVRYQLLGELPPVQREC